MWKLTEEEKLEFIKNKFYLEGLEGRLVQQETNNPKIYNGPFIIRQSSKAFEITVFIPAMDPHSLIKNSMRSELKIGGKIPDNHYYILEGRDCIKTCEGMQVDFKKFRNRNKDFKVIERLKFEQ